MILVAFERGIIMNLKRVSAFFVTLLLLIAAGVCVHAADFSVVGEEDFFGEQILKLEQGEAFSSYRQQIVMEGGNENFTFKKPTINGDGYDPGIWPTGLDVTEDGWVYGIPEANSIFMQMNVLITSKIDGTTRSLKCHVSFRSRNVIAIVTSHTYAYTGEARQATVKFTDMEGNDLPEIKPIIRYLGKDNIELTEAVDADTYYIKVTSPTGCVIARRQGDSYLTINPLAPPFIVMNNKTVQYTGQPQGMTEEDITVTPSVSYNVEYRSTGTDTYTVQMPTNSGTYDVRVYTTNPNYATSYAYATLTIQSEVINFNVSNYEVTYNGSEQEPTIEPSKDIDYTVSYTDAQGNHVEGKPQNAGVYNIVIALADPNTYSIGAVTSRTFTINPQEVTFKIPVKSYTYAEGVSHSPVIEPSIEGFDLYTVEYQRIDQDGNPLGEPVTQISEVGTYDVLFSLTDTLNYVFGTGNAQYVEVSTQTIDFRFEDLEKEYNGEAQYATVITDEEFKDCYDVVYTQNNVSVAEPTDAGSYYITINPIHGYGTGSKTPEYPYLVIAPKPITFSITKPSVQYDGNPQTTTLSNSENIETGFTVKYRDKNGNMLENVTEAGVYDVIVELTNKNYSLENSLIGTFTVETRIVMNLGNSPAAMIYADVAHINEPDWQEAAFNQLQTNNKFSAEYLPAGCNADILYNPIDGNNYDTDTSTVIVSNLNNFTDPGLMVNSTRVKGSAPVQVEGVEGLYKVTYTHDDETYERYVMVVGRIGDTNGDGSVNAVDANVFDKLTNNTPANVLEARVWDVNKDGRIDGDDASAIRSRFKTPLTSYYPWIK